MIEPGERDIQVIKLNDSEFDAFVQALDEPVNCDKLRALLKSPGAPSPWKTEPGESAPFKAEPGTCAPYKVKPGDTDSI